QTFSQALINHVLDGRVDSEVAANAATNRHDFLVELEQAIKRKRAAEARPVEQPQHVAEPEDVPAPTLATAEPDEGLGLRIVPAGSRRRRRLATLAVLAGLAVLGGTARADTFAVVPDAPLALPGLSPNPSLVIPADLSAPPASPEQLSYPELLAIWQRAG